jgi:tetratricopeptide (TPR) repeat protein
VRSRCLPLALAIISFSAGFPSRGAPAPSATDPDYFYQRGLARWGNGQPLLAMQDFDQALKLKPDDVPALVSRAELRAAGHDHAGAAADLDAAGRAAAKGADIRLTIGGLYTRLGRLASAVAQYDLWIATHPESARMPAALEARCWARALEGRELKKALGDCNAALRLKPDIAGLLDSRALVELRLGRFAQSISDYDGALRSQPKNAWLLCARGMAELRAGRKATGQADIAAAKALQPGILEVARERGLTP